MKISSIHSNYGVSRLFNKNYLTNSINKNETKIQEGMPSTFINANWGKDLVSFKSQRFQDTIKDNYFQLPLNCTPDEFQIDAGQALYEGKDVLVEAPTGTGKTAIAHYAATNNMQKGKTTFYTTPLKALSNQKLNEFRKVYGEENVGILTGDRRENVEAPIIIMTTEVYRNMALSNAYGNENPLMKNLGTVIFDEFHYLDDEDRGPVWEESVMYTPKDVKTLALSATIGNPDELTGWMNSLDENNTKLVSIPSSARHVPLKYESLVTGSYKAEEKKLKKKMKHSNVFMFEQTPVGFSPKPNLSDFKFAVDKLDKKEQLPAIFFVFSRKFSRELLDYLAKEGNDLTSKEEKEEIDRIVREYDKKEYLGTGLDVDALKKGYAVHNAGIMPQQKELIEELFQKKLIKTVIATETLAAGINMPAKTVVISCPYKPSDNQENEENEGNVRSLTANEFKQMAGRAGRRGIDSIGYVYTMPTDMTTEIEFNQLQKTESNPILSKYEPEYSFLAGYYEYNDKMDYLPKVYEKTFYTYSKDADESAQKLDELMDISKKRTDVLFDRGFLTDIDSEIKPSLKGLMASKVKGYDTLPLIEMIENKSLKDVSPESLALIAGAMSTPAVVIQEEINIGTDLSFIFSKTSDNIDRVRYSLTNLINKQLHKFGTSISNFDGYPALLKYLVTMEMPEESEEELKAEFDKADAVRKKYYKITSSEKKYSYQTLLEAMQKGETIPTAVLKEYFDITEEYKKVNKVRNFDNYIEELQTQIHDLEFDSYVKGNKAKEKNETRVRDLKSQLAYAEAIKYFDGNLLDVIGENYKFVKSHPLSEVRENYEKAQANYAKSNLRGRLICAVEGLVSSDWYMKNNDIDADAEKNHSQVCAFMDDASNRIIDITNTELKYGLPSRPKFYNKTSAKILYNWAMLNQISTDSITNWEELIQLMASHSDMDEGSIYRSVMQAADLLSQIGEIAEVGKKYSKTQEDIEYYSELKEKAAYTRNLIIKEPATM